VTPTNCVNLDPLPLQSGVDLNRSRCGKCKTQVHRKHFSFTFHFSKSFSFFFLSASAQHNTNRSKRLSFLL